MATTNRTTAWPALPRPPVPPVRPPLERSRMSAWESARSFLSYFFLDPEFDNERYHYSRPVLTRSASRPRPRLTRRRRFFGPDTSYFDSVSTLPDPASRRSTRADDLPPPPPTQAAGSFFGAIAAVAERSRSRSGSGPSRKPSTRSSRSVYSSDERDTHATSSSEQDQEPYHVFSRRRKWLVVVLVGFAGVFSGISSNMYFPALDQIAADLGVSTNEVNISITTYLIMQGVAPVFWSAFADTVGRRPVYVASFGVYIVANVMLSFTPNFVVLVIGRAVQAAGSASTVSIGNGVMQDISSPAERAAFISFYQAIRNFAVTGGPVLGGVLSNFLGFRAIFIFLLISSSIMLVLLVIFLPETLRSIAGNGSLRLTGWCRPWIYRVAQSAEPNVEGNEMEPREKMTAKTLFAPFAPLRRKDVVLNLLFYGVIYTVWQMVTSSTTDLFKQRFGLSELLLGVAYLPNGIGTIIGSILSGKLITGDFHAYSAEYAEAHHLPASQPIARDRIPPDFPLEAARLRHLPWLVLVFSAAVAAYGWTLGVPELAQMPGWIAVPLVLQFVIAVASNALFVQNQTLLSDLCPGKGASGMAVTNLVRCGLAAVGVGVVDAMIVGLGAGPTFAGLGLLVLGCTPLIGVSWIWGMRWRMERAEREGREENSGDVNLKEV